MYRRLRSSALARFVEIGVAESGQNLKLDIQDEVAVVRLDAPDAKVNSLSRSMMTDFVQVR